MLEATGVAVDNPGPALTNLLGKSTSLTIVFSRQTYEEGISQGPWQNSNFIASLDLNLNSFGIHFFSVKSFGSFLVAQTIENHKSTSFNKM